MTDVAATRVKDVLDISRMNEVAGFLRRVAIDLHRDEQREPDTNLSMRLALLRLEMERLSKDYAREALRLSLTASVESGE